jgi:hypothetical protein
MEKDNEPTQNELRDFVGREVYYNQSMLVGELFDKEIFSYEDVVNYYRTAEMLENEGYSDEDIERMTDNGENAQEVFEWWLCSDFLSKRLKEQGEPILKTDFGSWWGRTCTGQAIYLDSVIETIYKEMSKI